MRDYSAMRAGYRVALIDPPTGLFIREDRCQAPLGKIGIAAARPSIELLSMAAVFEAGGCECAYRDFANERRTWGDVRQMLIAFRPDILVVNTTSPTVHADLQACRIAKGIDRAVMTIARGAHFLEHDRDILEQYPDLDIAVRGEPEPVARKLAAGAAWDTIAGIAFRAQGHVQRTACGAWQSDLDALPFPARHLMNLNLYRNVYTGERETTIQAARGCAQQCVFCIARELSGPVVRSRSARSIAAEIEECVCMYNIRSFFLRADTFTADRAWVLEICDALRARDLDIRWSCNARADTIDAALAVKMRQSGCAAVTMGIESGDQTQLDAMKKGITIADIQTAVRILREQGIIVIGYFMIGFPDDTRHTMRRTMRFSTELGLDAANFYIAYPFAGSEFRRICAAEGLLIDHEYKKLPYVEAALNTRHVRARELEAMRRAMIRHFYLRPGFLLRQLWRFARGRRWRAVCAAGSRLILNGVVR